MSSNRGHLFFRDILAILNNMKSQLRQDLVSGDWIVIAPGRSGRPHNFFKNPEKRIRAPKKGCPFESIGKINQKKPILIYGESKNWRLQIVENKYPAFVHKDVCASILKDGPYSIAEGVGHHDLVVTRDHNDNFSKLSKNDARQVFEAFRDRYLMLLNDKCLSYVSIFHNWGPKAGASIYHPHYQIISLPIIPPDVEHSLSGSVNYFKKNKKCVHCVMIEWEKKKKKRIIYENGGAIAFAPFVSKSPFEIRIFPKKHLPYFENTLDENIDYAVDALRHALKKIEKNLKDPDYNFFLHTAPISNKLNYKMYHWHIEVIPKVSIRAGFELGTGVDINPVDPDEAATLLSK